MLGNGGAGYIKLYTAIDLLEKYNENFSNSDPLGIKHFNGNYNQLVLALQDSHDNTKVKFAGLMVSEGYQWGFTNVSNWGTLTEDQKFSFAVYYYNVGEDFVNALRTEAIAETGNYIPDLTNTDIAQQYILSISEIEMRSDVNEPYLSG